MIPEVASAFSRLFEVTPKLPGDVWPCENVKLTTGARKGSFSHDLVPAMREVYKASSQHRIEQLTVMAGPQNGKTLWMTSVMMQRGLEQKHPQLYVTSTKTKAGNWAVDSLRKAMVGVRAFDDKLPKASRWRYDLSKAGFNLADYTVKFEGGQTDTGIKQITVALLVLDEVDAWLKYGGGRGGDESKSAREAPFVDMAKARVSTYRMSLEALILIASTPSVETGAIYQEYLQGTQETFRPLCPCCKKPWPHRITIADYDLSAGYKPIPKGRKDQSRGLADYDMTALRSGAAWVCPRRGCKGRVTNDDWAWSCTEGAKLENGGWVADNPQKTPRHRSFQLSKHVGIPEDPEWIGEIAVTYVQSSFKEGGIHDFYNKFEGWPYVQVADNRDENELDRVIEFSPGYQMGPIMAGKLRKFPKGCLPVAIFSTMDVQARAVVYVVRCVDVFGKTWLLDAGYVDGCDVMTAASSLLSVRWETADGRKKGIYEIWCDAGYKAGLSGSVYETCRAFPDHFFACAGRDRSNHGKGMVGEVNRVAQIDPGTKDEILVYWLDDALFKRRLYSKLLAQAGNDNWEGWYLPTDIDDVCPAYKKHMLSEREQEQRDKTIKWQLKGPNDFGDAEKYNVALRTYRKDEIADMILEEREHLKLDAVD